MMLLRTCLSCGTLCEGEGQLDEDLGDQRPSCQLGHAQQTSEMKACFVFVLLAAEGYVEGVHIYASGKRDMTSVQKVNDGLFLFSI